MVFNIESISKGKEILAYVHFVGLYFFFRDVDLVKPFAILSLSLILLLLKLVLVLILLFTNSLRRTVQEIKEHLRRNLGCPAWSLLKDPARVALIGFQNGKVTTKAI